MAAKQQRKRAIDSEAIERRGAAVVAYVRGARAKQRDFVPQACPSNLEHLPAERVAIQRGDGAGISSLSEAPAKSQARARAVAV